MVSDDADSDGLLLSPLEQSCIIYVSDLAPKLLLARGSMVDLLVSSDIAKYADFRIVSRILTYQGDKLKHVPCCRADVFNSKEVKL